MRLKSITCLISCLVASHVQAKCKSLTDIDWLLGKWHASVGTSKAVEEWLQVSEHTFEGMGKTVSSAGEIENFEVLRMVYLRDNVYYFADVQHNPLPIAFAATTCTSGEVRFENLKHDFPNVIHYKKTGIGYSVAVEDTSGKGFTLIFTE